MTLLKALLRSYGKIGNETTQTKPEEIIWNVKKNEIWRIAIVPIPPVPEKGSAVTASVII